MSDTLTMINAWHAAARPNPNARNFNVQLGCHFEEVLEMLDAVHINTDDAKEVQFWLGKLARKLKSGEAFASISDARGLLDSLADQVVTATGVGYCGNMTVPLACAEVNRSNWSKFVDGKPVFDNDGKIAKGPNYTPPNLTGMF